MLSNSAVPIEYGKFRSKVLRGEIPVNMEISMQMNRIDRLIESPDYYYDSDAIEGFVRFCEAEMVLTDGSQVKLLDSFKLWAEDALAWFYYKEEKYYDQYYRCFKTRRVLRRLIHVQYLIVGRSAAKTMYVAYMHGYFLYIDKSSTHQIVVAPTKDMADETLSPLRTAITVHPGPLLTFYTLGNKFSKNDSTKAKTASTKRGIENYLTNSLVEVRPMRIDKLQGLRCKIASVDEWLSGAAAKEDVIGALEQGAAKGNTDDYLILATSSEGTVRDGIGDTIKMDLLSILRGDIIDPHTSIWYYKLDNVKEVGMPNMWIKANPNLGATVSYETYEKAVQEAEQKPSRRNDILAKRFGIPVEGFTYYFTYEETLVHPHKSFDGMDCSMGADLSQGDDFCAFTFIFPLGNEQFGIKTRAYVSRNKVIKLPQAMQNKYNEFVNEGSLIVMDGGILEMMDVYEDLDSYITEHDYSILSFGYDPYNSEAFVNRFVLENGPYGVSKVRQGYITESVPLGELKNLAEVRALIFDQELMKFSMGNSVAIEDNNGNLKLSKKRAEEKIDSVAALLDAWVGYKRNIESF